MASAFLLWFSKGGPSCSPYVPLLCHASPAQTNIKHRPTLSAGRRRLIEARVFTTWLVENASAEHNLLASAPETSGMVSPRSRRTLLPASLAPPAAGRKPEEAGRSSATVAALWNPRRTMPGTVCPSPFQKERKDQSRCVAHFCRSCQIPAFLFSTRPVGRRLSLPGKVFHPSPMLGMVKDMAGKTGSRVGRTFTFCSTTEGRSKEEAGRRLPAKELLTAPPPLSLGAGALVNHSPYFGFIGRSCSKDLN